jgi:hypothetical protein
MENTSYTTPKVKIEGTLRDSQRSEMNKWKCTYNKEEKYPLDKRIVAHSDSLAEAITLFNVDEFEVITFTYTSI